MKIEIEVESVKMLREQLCLAQLSVQTDLDWNGVHSQERVSATLGNIINVLDHHRPLGADGKHGNKHTKTCGCEDKFSGFGLDIRNYIGSFRGVRTGTPHAIEVRAVQWDGTEEHFMLLKKWVVTVRPIQEPDYYPDPESYLGTDGPSFTLGMGNDFGDFFTAEPGDYLYLHDNYFRATSAEEFEKQFKEIMQ